MKLNIFRATHRPLSGAQNCTSSLWFCVRESLLDAEIAGRCQRPAISASNNLLRIFFIVAPCMLLRLFLLFLHRACCYDSLFYCCTMHVVMIISFIVAPCMFYDSLFYCCTVHVVTILSFIVAPCMLLWLFSYCCTMHAVTIISFIVAPCMLLRFSLLLLHHACCYDYFFYCCTVHVVTIISFIVAPCMLLRFSLLFQLTHTFIHFKNTNSH